ncbi:Hpt domain-containing protein [Catenuloplanes japonicus]|uniref:Hpt domain-containing protein n=1 Tax=Catenuloplanes japonicus TaxID=33876 RepID=UPI00069121A6|nr:Hpt domain-containing protein [Catenuloplanes japonicus]
MNPGPERGPGVPREDALRDRLLDIAGPEPSTAERALMVRLIESFLRKVPLMLDLLEAELAAEDPDASRVAAHALRGSASNIGADGLALLAGALEDEIRAGRIPDASAISALRAEATALRPVFESTAARLADS